MSVLCFEQRAATAHEREINSDTWLGIAIEGFDPVAYVVDGEAASGLEAFSIEWGGVTWRFRSETNKQLFRDAPESFVPVYGGYGAYGMSQGFRANINPYAFDVQKGRVYLFASEQAKDTWAQNMAGYRALADKNWTIVKDQNF